MNFLFPQFYLSCVSTFALAVCAGCGGSYELVEAGGKITIDGKPVDNAEIKFHPSSGGRVATAVTDSNGVFKLVYSRSSPGLPPGEYLVSIEAIKAEGNSAPQVDERGDVVPTTVKFTPAIPEKYFSKKTSGLKVTVANDSDNVHNFDLKW